MNILYVVFLIAFGTLVSLITLYGWVSICTGKFNGRGKVVWPVLFIYLLFAVTCFVSAVKLWE